MFGSGRLCWHRLNADQTRIHGPHHRYRFAFHAPQISQISYFTDQVRNVLRMWHARHARQARLVHV